MNRVVVTGIGLISPLGHNVKDSWDGIVNGRSGVGPITLFDTTNSQVKHAAEVKNFDPKSVLDHKEARRQDRFQWLANAAASEALESSGLEITDANRDRIGVAVSSGAGGLNSMDESFAALFSQGPRGLNPFAIPKIMSNGASGVISIRYGVCGPSFSVASACASGSDGIGMASQLIKAGAVDVMIAGGAEAPVTALTVGAFDRIGAASHRSDGAPSPFSASRDGLIVGEGSGVLILESLEHARNRGATLLAEIVGYGASADAFHITAPTDDGSGSAKAVRRALEDARLEPGEIDYVSAHGTGTALNDESETRSLKLALGDSARRVAISSTKSMTGHMMGATGAVEAVFCILAIRDCVAPATINFTDIDDKCDLDYVPNSAREMPIHVAMSNSFGFGGHNSVLIIRSMNGRPK
jgi:beta-ketoacyl-acyl-carrier-protein synthase II